MRVILKIWNRDTFGNIFTNIMDWNEKISMMIYTIALIDHNTLPGLENDYWKWNFRAPIIKDMDRKTRFFHNFASYKQRMKKNDRLKVGENNDSY